MPSNLDNSRLQNPKKNLEPLKIDDVGEEVFTGPEWEEKLKALLNIFKHQEQSSSNKRRHWGISVLTVSILVAISCLISNYNEENDRLVDLVYQSDDLDIEEKSNKIKPIRRQFF